MSYSILYIMIEFCGKFSGNRKKDATISKLCIIPQSELIEVAKSKLTRKFVPIILLTPYYISPAASVIISIYSIEFVIFGNFSSI